LQGAEPASRDDDGPLLCFHAATRPRGGASYEATGGRVATFVGLGDDLVAAREVAYRGVSAAQLDGGQFRTDIAAREVVAA
jgi:phosphoribosylamine--glycine ligase